jgi:hypothetical protein
VRAALGLKGERPVADMKDDNGERGSGMAFALRPQRALHLALPPAIAIACLLAGCQARVPAVGAAPGGPSSTVTVPPASRPITVTVAPASVAPGATHIGASIPAFVSAPSLPAPVRYAIPCPSYPPPKQIPVHVVPGYGSALISWINDGDGAVQTYRVTAVSQRLVAGSQPAPPSVTTARGNGCGARSVNVRGLRHGTAYVFWLEEGSPDPAGGLRYEMVGQSTGVLVP